MIQQALAERKWVASPKQNEFLNRPEQEVFFGGAKYGAKTDGLLVWSIIRRRKYAGSRGLFIRREMTEITKQGAAWDRALELTAGEVAINKVGRTLTWPNGSVLEFGHCQHESDKYHYQGAQYDDLAFDQIEQFTESQYLYICAACRTATSDPPRDREGRSIQNRIRATGNPGDVGHSWVKARFIDIAAPGTTYKYQVRVPTPQGLIVLDRSRVFIPSLPFDNPHASPEYLAVLYALPEPYRSAYLYGNWDVFVGQAFPDFHPLNEVGQPYHVIPTAPIPAHWRRHEGHDWGYSAPCYTCWGAVDPEGGVIIYKELWGRGWEPTEIATRILEVRGGDRVVSTWAGHDIWQEHRARITEEQKEALREKGLLRMSIEAHYRAAGLNTCRLPFTLDRLARLQRYHEMLKPRSDGVPFLRIMDNCPVLTRTLQLIQLDERRTEDVVTEYAPDADVRDDPYDGCGFLLLSLPKQVPPLLPGGPEPAMVWVGGRR